MTIAPSDGAAALPGVSASPASTARRARRTPTPTGGRRPFKNTPTEAVDNTLGSIRNLAEITRSIDTTEVYLTDKRRIVCESYAALNELRRFIHILEDNTP